MVNGKSELLYTPFVVATVTSFSNKNNSNVIVTNGRVVDTGLGYSIVALSTSVFMSKVCYASVFAVSAFSTTLAFGASLAFLAAGAAMSFGVGGCGVSAVCSGTGAGVSNPFC